MKIVIDIPTDQYNEIVYVNYERLRDIFRDGVVIEKCEDAISREAVLNTEYQIKNINDVEFVMLSEVQMKMRKLPSVTPQRPKGEWIKVITDIDEWGETWHFKCSICGEKSNKGYRPLENYCPNCGAEMGGDPE